MNEFGEFVKTVTRPILGIMFGAVFAQSVTQGIELPDWYIALGVSALGTWFVQRTVQNIKGKL